MAHQDHFPGTFFGPPTLVELLQHRASLQPDDAAFIYLVDGESEQVVVTNRELDRQARAIGAWLESHGLVGQQALLLYPPGLEFIAAFFGCLYAGVVAVPVYPPRRNRSMMRIQAIADDAEAKVALTTDVVLRRVEPLIDETPHLKELTWLATCHVPERMEEQWQPPDIHTDTLAFLQYTSGSTGTPKGVMLNHSNLLHNSALIAHGFEHTRSCRGVFWLPSYHDMGLIGGILQPLYVGRPNIIMSPMAFLQKPYRWLAAISKYGATTSGGPNFAYDLCVRKVTPAQRATLDLSKWTVAFNGAEPVREETLERFAETFASCGFRREAFYPCFGLAEATLIVSGGLVLDPPTVRAFDSRAIANNQVVECDPDDESARMLVGCGGTLPDQKIVIADPEQCTTCPPDGIGEIWVSGPSVACGYWRQEEATRRTFHAYLADTGEGPFLRTGDLGFLRNGELFVTGRIKDLMIYRGVNIYPQDIEQTVERSHESLPPNCGAAFVLESGGEERIAVVQEIERRHRGGDFDAIIDAVRRAVSAEHEIPLDSVVLVRAGSIPKTSSSKIQRHACRQGFLDGTLDVVARWDAATSPARPLTAPAGGAPRRPVTAASGNGARTKEPKATVPRAATAPSAPAAAVPKSAAHPHVATAAQLERVCEVVMEQVRLIGKERADGLSLDDPVTEIGLDSLERMEILASLEERFGGRFPEEILLDLQTGRQVAEAVAKYMGTTPRERAVVPEDAEIPEETYQFAKFPEFIKLRERLQLIHDTGLGNPFFTVHEGITSDETTIGGRRYINFCSYNYAGMAGDPAVIRAVQEAAAKYGASVSASRLVSGEKDIHGELERELARWLHVEDAVAFVTGHSTNESVIGHLMGPGDLILQDSLSHNSIVQGSIMSGARRRPFIHNDWQAAEDVLRRYRHDYRRVLLVIEGVYSMDGDIPDLPRFVEIKKRHKALLMIDEAHSMGTIGASGQGIQEYHGVPSGDVDIWMGTLSKALGSCGGYIGGCKELVEYLKYTTPGFVFSVGMSPAATAAALASIRLLKKEPQRVAKLQANAKLFLELAKARGLNTGMSKDTPVVPIILGNSIRSLALSRAMFARGVNVQPIVHPAVEESAARLRFFITSLHSEAQIRKTVGILVEELARIDADFAARAAAGAAC